MANFAFVKDNEIQGIYDTLPINWDRISNFHANEGNEEFLNSFGWYTIDKVIPEYNSETHTLEIPIRTYNIEENKVYETYEIIEKHAPVSTDFDASSDPIASLDHWSDVREERDRLIKDFEWRYMRYERQVRLGIEPTDDIQKMDEYIQALADITKQSDPMFIDWPNYANYEL